MSDQSIHGRADICAHNTLQQLCGLRSEPWPHGSGDGLTRGTDALQSPQLPAASTHYMHTPGHSAELISLLAGHWGGREGEEVDTPAIRPWLQTIPRLSLRYVAVWVSGPGPARPTGPALSMHGRPQLSFYFGSMEAYLGPAGPSETMDTVPYPNSGAQTIWRTPGSRREARRTPSPPRPPAAQ